MVNSVNPDQKSVKSIFQARAIKYSHKLPGKFNKMTSTPCLHPIKTSDQSECPPSPLFRPQLIIFYTMKTGHWSDSELFHRMI